MTDWSEEKPTLELLKSMVTMTDVVEMLGFEVDNHGKITSPWNPDERTPSCHVYEDHIYDYGTGNFADIIDLVQLVDPTVTLGKAVWLLWNKGLRAGREPGDVETQVVKNVVDFSDDWNLKGAVPTPRWRGEIGCSLPSTVRESIVADELLVAHRDEEGIYGVKTRSWLGAKGAWPGSQFTKRLYHPYGYEFWDDMPLDVAVITEGESDCWHVNHFMDGHADVYALPSGAGSWKDSWLDDLAPYERVIVIMDNDRAGEAARDKLRSKIGWLRVEDLYVPALYNDVREAVKNGWDGRQLLEQV